MDELSTGVIMIGLLFVFVVGRRVVLWRELTNASRARRERETQARIDHERFERELTDEKMRAGAR